MIGIVVVAHSHLADQFIAVTEHIVGKQPQLVAVAVQPDDNLEKRRHDILQAVKSVDTGRGVVILTDMFGGTPSNLAFSVMGTAKLEVISGLNLPMIVKLVSVREEMPLEEAVLSAQESGRKYINVASNLLRKRAAG